MMKEKKKTNWVLTIVLNFGDGYGIFPAVYGSDHCV